MNEKTAYIDGSQIYGTDDEMMNSLRTMEDGLLIAQVRTRNDFQGSMGRQKDTTVHYELRDRKIFS